MSNKTNMPDIVDGGGLFGVVESRDSRIERLSRESERKTILLKLQKCKAIKDYEKVIQELEQSI